MTVIKQNWHLQVRYQPKAKLPYIAYARHLKSRAVVREGAYLDVSNAITAGGDLVCALNRTDPKGKKYPQKDKLFGKAMNQVQINELQFKLSSAMEQLIKANDKIFGTQAAKNYKVRDNR